MKTGFKQTLEPKSPEKKLKSPWNFEAPSYDERTSCYVNAGTHYGSGFRQPVGSSVNAKQNVEVLPRGKVDTMETVSKSNKNLPIQTRE